MKLVLFLSEREANSTHNKLRGNFPRKQLSNFEKSAVSISVEIAGV
jgi:hypothetical protein